MFYFFTNNKVLLLASLQRYSRYILSQELKTFSKSELLTSSDTILVHQNEREAPELLNFLANKQDAKIVIVGFNDSAFLNLIDLSNLKNNLEQIISSAKLNSTQLFTEEELKEKLKNFFHSHGEDSLFEYLNYTTYFLDSGIKQLLSNDISYEEFKNVFLLPGLKNWDKFNLRFLKYKDILKLSIYKPIVNSFEIAINDANEFISRLSDMSQEEICKNNIKNFVENIDKVKLVEKILTEFFKRIYIGETHIQNDSC